MARGMSLRPAASCKERADLPQSLLSQSHRIQVTSSHSEVAAGNRSAVINPFRKVSMCKASAVINLSLRFQQPV